MTFRSLSFTQMLSRTAAIVALSSAACGVSAQTAAEPAAPTKDKVAAAFARADANGDGKLSKEEAARMPAVSAKFAQFDKDKDGSLSPAEFAAGVGAAP
jgi:Ca2+-binding EF-hand superfamily protein